MQTIKSTKNKDAVFSFKGRSLEMDEKLQGVKLNGTTKEAINGSWILKNKHNWDIEIKSTNEIGHSITVNKAKSKTSLYARTILRIDTNKESIVSVFANLDFTGENFPSVTFSAYSDEKIENLIDSITKSSENGRQIHGSLRLPRNMTIYLLIQINFPAEQFVAEKFKIGVYQNENDSTFRPTKFNLTSFGDYKKASARLRCWMLAEALEEAGHEVFVNSDIESDVHYFQKVRSFKKINQISNTENQLLVFDFDDNYFLDNKGDLFEFVSFINQMDVLTVGSEYLAKIATQYHPHVMMIDNPADINKESTGKVLYGWTNNVGWFGAPESQIQLGLVDYTGSIKTITQGGSIEYDQETIDTDLVQFDLLLFPLEINEWTAAKNANRMVKAIALGIPVLASATAEHIRAAELVGMDNKYLVQEQDSWSEKISQIKAEYASVAEDFKSYKASALQSYDSNEFAKQFYMGIHHFGKRDIVKYKTLDSRLNSVDLLSIDLNSSYPNLGNIEKSSEIDFKSFANVLHYCTDFPPNEMCEHENISFVKNDNVLELFSSVDQYINSTSAEYILLVNGSVSLMKPFLNSLDFNSDVRAFDLSIFGSAKDTFPKHPLEAYEILQDRSSPDVLLIKTSWLRSRGILAAEMLSWFSLAIWMESLVSGNTVYSSTDYPVGVQHNSSSPENISKLYAEMLIAKDGSMACNIPSVQNQWIRMSHDIVHTILQRNPDAAAGLAARFLKKHYSENLEGKAA